MERLEALNVLEGETEPPKFYLGGSNETTITKNSNIIIKML